ncbi:hypothetical protein KOW79_017445 [Hemibagrus wyckioides]|uniref:RNA-binding protein 15B n=1 Tax=Hemibagrus wyckioides TaxID=337641 RepID=A0A9D3N8Z6_9TELE|nr:hypothetical protein KOW79_017445 [Hemibagrus wyckioides]
MKRQAERDSSPSRALAKRIRERERDREGSRREDAAAVSQPPLALLLAESRSYQKQQQQQQQQQQRARSRSGEREKPRAREERAGLLPRPPSIIPKSKAPVADPLGGSRGASGLEYKTLLISNLGSQLSDEHVEDGLFHEFKKFGDVSVKLSHTPELGRIAYVNFRQPESAREARHAKARLVLYDRPLKIEPMYVRRRSLTPPDVAYVPLHGPALEERSRAYAYPLPEDDLMPEDDQRATRNLFIGNLDHNVSEAELRQGFDKYGIIEEIVIKRPARGQGCGYGFIKFQNLDMAHRAKVAMQGRVFGGNQVKIGYGKANPTTRLWVGGLGPNTSLAALAREFDRFGSIRTIDYMKGDNFAYIHYESLDAAQAACAQMRGFPLGGRRLRVDFAKAEETRSYPQQYPPPIPLPSHYDIIADGFGRHRSLERELRARARSPSHPLYAERERERGLPERDWSPPKGTERRSNPEAFGRTRARSRSRERWAKGWEERRKRRSRTRSRSISPGEQFEERGRSRVRAAPPKTPDDSPERTRGRLPDSTSDPQDHTPDSSRHSSDERPAAKAVDPERNHCKTDTEPDSHSEKPKSEPKKPSTLSEYAQTLSRVWHGSLVLKNSCFPTSMHLLDGGANFFLSLLKDQTNSGKITQLKIAQRLRLDQPKLDEVSRRIRLGGADGYTVLLAVQGPMDRDSPPPDGLQKRFLRNLVTYLRSKQAAGVIGLPLGGPKERETGGMLYAFPPCDFSQQYLQTVLKTLGKVEEEHLVVVVVKDSAQP